MLKTLKRKIALVAVTELFSTLLQTQLEAMRERIKRRMLPVTSSQHHGASHLLVFLLLSLSQQQHPR